MRTLASQTRVSAFVDTVERQDQLPGTFDLLPRAVDKQRPRGVFDGHNVEFGADAGDGGGRRLGYMPHGDDIEHINKAGLGGAAAVDLGS